MQFNAMEGYTGGRCGNLIEMKGDGRTAEWARKCFRRELGVNLAYSQFTQTTTTKSVGANRASSVATS
jgi:hypothetical protein